MPRCVRPRRTTPACSKPCSKWRTAPSPIRSRYNLLPHIAGGVRPRAARRQESALGAVPDQPAREAFRTSAARTRSARPAPANKSWRDCLARLKQIGRARTGRPPRTAGRTAKLGRGHPRNAARPAAAVRRHRRELFRALGHLAHGPGQRAMTYHIIHRTLYEYAAPVTVSHHVARLEPRATATQERDNFSLKIFPEPALRKTRAGLFRQPALLFQHPGDPQPPGNHHAQPRDRARATSRRRRNRRRPGRRWRRLFRDPVSPEVVEPYQFVFDSPQVRASFELADYARRKFSRGHAAAGRGART